MKKDYKELYEKITNSDWFKKAYHNKSLGECPIVIDELEESEDEKIRKSLIEDFRNYYEMYDKSCGEPKWGSDHLMVKDILTWLERRKEQKPLLPEDKVKHPLYVEGFEAGKEVGRQYENVFGKQKEQKPNIELIQRSWYMQGYCDGKYSREPKWITKTGEGGPKHELNPRYGEPLVEEQKPITNVFGFKIGDKVRLKDGDGRTHIIKSFEEVEGLHGPNFYHVEFEDNSARDGIYPGEEYPNGFYTQMEKIEEEQKPRKFKVGDKVHWQDDNMNVITITGFRDDAYLTDSAYGPISFCDENNWERVEQKPAEWGDEDSDNLERVDNYLWMLDNYIGDDCAMPQRKTDKIRRNIQEVLSPWLKSLPERLNLQPKQEWSEEDEGVLNNIITAFHRIANGCDHYFSQDTAKVFEETLKSLSSKSKQEWSEEDERMLSRCIKSIETSKQFADSNTFNDAKDKEISWLKSNSLNFKKKNEDVAKLCSNEWSEEDERKLQKCIKIVERWEEDHDIAYAPYSDMLKALHPLSNQEWSEEDYEALDMCLDAIPKGWKTKSGILLTKWLKDNIRHSSKPIKKQEQPEVDLENKFGWHNVSEKTPKFGDYVIVACKNKNKEDGIWLYDLIHCWEGKWEPRENWETPLKWISVDELGLNARKDK